MDTLKRVLFKGTLRRKRYFLLTLFFIFVLAIIVQIAKEESLMASTLVWSIGLFLKTILDAKRLRDIGVPGKFAPIVVGLYLILTVPAMVDAIQRESYFALLEASNPAPWFILLSAQCYLFFKKGEARGDGGEVSILKDNPA